MNNREAKERIKSLLSYMESLDADEEEKKDIEALHMAIEALEQTEWISVKDRLPENTNNVLMSCSNFDQCTGELYKLVIVGFYKESCGWLMDGYSCPYSVDAWMPKPSPYKGE